MCGCLVSDEFGLLLEGGGAAGHITFQIFPIVFLNTGLYYSIYIHIGPKTISSSLVT
jgi:hypothetical protein